MARIVAWLMIAVLGVVTIGLGAGGWYYSDQLLPAPIPGDPVYDVAVLASDEAAGTVELDLSDGDLVELGTVGLLTSNGTVVLEGPSERRGASTSRSGVLLEGDWPRPGDLAAASVDTFAGDPASTLGLTFDEVSVPSELGVLPAWRRVPNGSATDQTWAILIHGRGSGLAESNRILTTIDDLGVPSLTISIRNDPDAAADPDGFGRYGDAEWEDLQAAIDHLRAVEGAQRFVLVGYSQGGSIALSFLRRSPDADQVTAAVLISPLVSLHETLVLQAEARNIPDPVIPPLLAATRWITTLRSGLDFDQVEHLERRDELPDIPMLLTHGDADATIPIGPTRELADALPDRVTYEEYEDTDHVREWNADRERFEDDLRRFLDAVVLAPVG